MLNGDVKQPVVDEGGAHQPVVLAVVDGRAQEHQVQPQRVQLAAGCRTGRHRRHRLMLLVSDEQQHVGGDQRVGHVRLVPIMNAGAGCACAGPRTPGSGCRPACVMHSAQIGRPQFEQAGRSRGRDGDSTCPWIPIVRSADCYQIPRSTPPSTGSTVPEMYAAGRRAQERDQRADLAGAPSRRAGTASMSRLAAASGSG